MTPFPYLQRAYSQVPPQPAKKAAAMYRPTGGGSGSRANKATTARPRHAENICTIMSMTGDYNG